MEDNKEYENLLINQGISLDEDIIAELNYYMVK